MLPFKYVNISVLPVSFAKFCGVITVECNVIPLHKYCSWPPCYLFLGLLCSEAAQEISDLLCLWWNRLNAVFWFGLN